MKKIILTTLTLTSTLAFANTLLPIHESFIGLQEGNINGQQTSPTPSDYFTGGEAWDAVTSAFDARGYRGSTTPLSFNGIGGNGGAVEVFRDTSFQSASLGTRASLTPNNRPTNLTYPESSALYFSFLVNFDGYTARADDWDGQGVLVDFDHDIGGGRPLGVHIGGATGGDNDILRLSLLTESGTGSGDADDISFVDSGLNLASGTNFVQLRIEQRHVTNQNQSKYELWLNPTSLSDPADFTHFESFGLATNNNGFGFDSFGISQSLNGEQSVFVDELYLGEVSAIPEPGTLVLVGITLGALMLFRKRRG